MTLSSKAIRNKNQSGVDFTQGVWLKTQPLEYKIHEGLLSSTTAIDTEYIPVNNVTGISLWVRATDGDYTAADELTVKLWWYSKESDSYALIDSQTVTLPAVDDLEADNISIPFSIEDISTATHITVTDGSITITGTEVVEAMLVNQGQNASSIEEMNETITTTKSSYSYKEDVADGVTGDWVTIPDGVLFSTVVLDCEGAGTIGYIEATNDKDAIDAETAPDGIALWENGSIEDTTESAIVGPVYAIRAVSTSGAISMMIRSSE